MENDNQSDKSKSPALMLSVRSAEEYRLLAGFGLNWIDVKDTAKGALGRPDLSTLAEFARQPSLAESLYSGSLCSGNRFGDRVNLSVALGELNDLSLADINDQQFRATAYPFRIFKVGLSGTVDDTGWINRWSLLRSALRSSNFKQSNIASTEGRSSDSEFLQRIHHQQSPPQTDSSAIQLVPVYYADYQPARSPDFDTVLKLAVDEQAEFLLIDTFDKSSGRLRDHQTDAELASWVERANEARVSVVLAGSLQLSDVDWARQVPCDVVGFRSAACVNGNRTDKLDLSRVERLCRAFDTDSKKTTRSGDIHIGGELTAQRLR